MHDRLRSLAIALLLAMVAVACSPAASPDDPPGDGAATGGVRIVVTTSILGDLVSDLVAGDGQVEVLIPAGVDPHGFAISAKQVAAINAADLVVANGLGLEASLGDVLTAAEGEGVAVLRVGEHVDALPLRRDDPEYEDGALDPHVWLDPLRMGEGVRVIAAELAQRPNTGPVIDWLTRANDLIAALEELDATVTSTLAQIPERCRVLVTDHGSFGYLADRYGFELLGSVVPGSSSQAQTDAQSFAALAEAMRERGVRTIFVGEGQATRQAEALASEVPGATVVPLFSDALGAPGSGAETYAGLLLTDADRIAAALTGC